MHKAPKKAKKRGQFSGSIGPQLVPMARKWSNIYDIVAMEKPSNKSLLMPVRDNDEKFSDTYSYDDELLKVQRSEIHKISSRLVVLPITNVMQWIAMHVDFWRLAVVVDNGKVLVLLAPDNF